MRKVFFPNQMRPATIKSIVIGLLIYSSIFLFLVLFYFQIGNIFSSALISLVMASSTFYFRTRLQWEIAPTASGGLEMYFRLAESKRNLRTFTKDELRDIVIEQDSERYFILYIVTANEKIKVERAPTRNTVALAKRELENVLKPF